MSEETSAEIIKKMAERLKSKERIEELVTMNKKLLDVAIAADQIMRAAHYDQMSGWQIGDVPLDILVIPLSEIYEAVRLGEAKES